MGLEFQFKGLGFKGLDLGLGWVYMNPVEIEWWPFYFFKFYMGLVRVLQGFRVSANANTLKLQFAATINPGPQNLDPQKKQGKQQEQGMIARGPPRREKAALLNS